MLPTLEFPELLFGICAPLGTDNRKVCELFGNALRSYHYGLSYFKVTTLMKSIKPQGYTLIETPLEKKYDSYINYANRIRDLFGFDYVLSMLCCTALRSFRRKEFGNTDKYAPRNAYIFDQFKRKEEVDLLRQLYGRLFTLISVYSDKEERTRRLAERIAASHNAARASEQHYGLAKNLVARDEIEEGELHGQRLEETFPNADLFLNIDDLEGAKVLIDRFIRGLFGSNSVSPNRDEYGMYLAKSASLRSLDLSRQVGAAILSPQGEIVTLGANEVPKAHGGTYWDGDEPDWRDYKWGHDENERIKRSLFADVVRRLEEGGFLARKAKAQEQDIVKYIWEESAKRGGSLRDAQVMDLLEFGRIIHAEMSAICDAARLGKSIRQSTLYCTTFPCHICAKHIVASGIARVVYIEPYPKSYAEQLHHDAIVVGKSNVKDKVAFEPFIGISPYRYGELFQGGRRKGKDGEYVEWKEQEARPIVKFTIATYLENEKAITKMFEKKARELKNKGLIQIT